MGFQVYSELSRRRLDLIEKTPYPKTQNIMVVCSFCEGMKQGEKRCPWHPKVPGEATVRNISKIALKIALFYSQTMSWEGCDVSLRRRRGDGCQVGEGGKMGEKFTPKKIFL